MISSAYTYYLSTYGGQQITKYDTHKKSELRSVYNNMLKINRKSPLYKITDTEDVQKYAIDLKETARSFKNVASSLTDIDGSISGFSRKKAVSSNPDIVNAEYIGEDDVDEEVKGFDIKVDSLATSQVNKGNYLNPASRNLKKGDYFFDINIGEYTYEFSFAVKEDDDNVSVQDKLIRLFNRSNIGVTASKDTNEAGDQAIVIKSNSTGLTGTSGNSIFNIVENEKSDGAVVSQLGINNMVNAPSNARFFVDGIEHNASSNTFSIKNQYRLTLNKVTAGDETVRVGVKQDVDSVLENVNELLSSYNNMVDLANSKSDNESDSNHNLAKDINSIAGYYRDKLESAGFRVEDDGHIKIEESVILQNIKEGNLSDSLEKLNDFKKAVVNKAEDISINPMKYVNKKLISYPHPTKNFTSPYVSSIYSGMMFNGIV